MGIRKRDMPHGRSRERRKRASRYLVVSNGEVTEKQYFDFLKKSTENLSIKFHLSVDDPGRLSKLAQKLWKADRDESNGKGGEGKSEPYKKVYIVSDVDDFTISQFKEAKSVCQNNCIELIVSNPCFEVWLIDHIRSCPESISHQNDAKRLANELDLMKGASNKEINFDMIEPSIEVAVENAIKHTEKTDRAPIRDRLDKLDFSPWTDMYLVIQELFKKQ